MKAFICLMVLMLAFGLATIGISQEDNQGVTYQQYLDLVRRIERLEGRSFTRYDTSGFPVNQAQNRKGYHKTVGEITLSAGTATVNLNNIPGEDKQSIDFISRETFHGKAWSTDTTNAKSYIVYPIDHNSFIIKCLTDTLDASTVKFQVEGE